MNGTEEHNPPTRRTNHVVSLPCGHRVDVGPDASLLAVSGPVFDHQASCRREPSPGYVAWFTLGPFSRGVGGPADSHSRAPAPLAVELSAP